MVYGVWRRSCYLPAGCRRGMGCWRPIGKASRRPWISEHVGKGREMMDGLERTMAMDALELDLGVGCFLKKQIATKSVFNLVL